MKHLLLFLLLTFSVTLSGAEITRQYLNNMLGIQLFADKDTWSKNALQKRLNIRFNGNDKRFSTPFVRNIAGAKPVEIEVHTAENNDSITIITVTFANKGDTRSKHKTAIRNAGRTVSGRLNKCAQRRKGGFSDGAFKIKGDMWQTKYARFILEVDKGDFVLLHILPPAGMKKAADPRDKDFSENVKNNNFGDTFIPNVPMVNQGSKGYCVPATMTRIFLYYGIHADMHHLAKMADTDRDDGTSTDKMLDEIKTLRKKANLKMKIFSDVSVKSVAKHIDKGHPVMWMMYSTSKLQQVYSFSRMNRQKAASPDEWKRALKKVSVSSSTEGPHALLIIGYNKHTDEIAVSNSWGNAHIAPLWIPVKVARKVSQEYLVVFEP